MELTPDWPSASRIRQPRLSVISLLRVSPPSTDRAIHASGENGRDRQRKGPGGQNNFALSANLSRSCARLSLSMHLPPLPLPPSCPFTSFHSFSVISALDPSLNKRPSAMLQDARCAVQPLSSLPSPLSPPTPLAYLAFSAEFQIRGRSFFIPAYFFFFRLARLLRTDKRVYYSGCCAITLNVG